MVLQVVEDVEYSALQTRQDPWDLLALAMGESRLNPRARSQKVGAFGQYQLHPDYEPGLSVRKACRKLGRRECDRLAALQGAEAIAVGVDKCGSFRRAVYNHRLNDCGRGPNSDKVANTAIAMRLWYAKIRRDVLLTDGTIQSLRLISGPDFPGRAAQKARARGKQAWSVRRSRLPQDDRRRPKDV